MTPPNPTHYAAARTSAARKLRKPRPLTDRLMERVRSFLMDARSKADGRITTTQFAKDVGIGTVTAREYIIGWRAAPNSETTLRIRLWCEFQERDMHTMTFAAFLKKASK